MANETEAAKTPDEIVAELGRLVVKLRKPAKYEDVEKAELVFDFDGLTGEDITRAFAEALAVEGGKMVPVPALDPRCQAYVAAKAAGVPSGLIMALGAKDFGKVTTSTMVFLTG